jgi:hypothetical protein
MQTRPLHVIVERFGQLADRFDVILVVGSDYTDVSSGTELKVRAATALVHESDTRAPRESELRV